MRVSLKGRERVDECERGERARQRRGQLMGQYQGLNQVEERSANGRGPRRRVLQYSTQYRHQLIACCHEEMP